MSRLIIIGAGGHGKVCAEIASDMEKWDEICFLDDSYPEKKKCLDFEIVGTIQDVFLFEKSDFFVGIGNNKLREKLIDVLCKSQMNIVTLIHPTAIVSKYSEVGIGSSIHQLSIINTDSKVGRGCIINTSAIIEHDCKIGEYVHISPNVSIAGNVSIENRTWIGIGSSIINNTKIASDVLIGANSTVIKDINNCGTYYGNPIK